MISLLIIVPTLLVGMFLFRRNQQVYDLFTHMIDDVFSKEDWQWRREKMNSVSYDTMRLRFWKPVEPESFYDDVSFLE